MGNDTIQTPTFVVLDRLFWLVWLAFPVLIFLTYRSLSDGNALQAQLPDVDPACVASIPQVANFSVAGKAATFAYYCWQYAIYAVLLAFAHMTIHRCAVGKAFVVDTLRALGVLGAIVVAWPFADLALSNLLAFIVYRTQDVKTFEANYFFDIGPFGVGLLLLTIRTVIAHAIALKQDHDLTI